MSRKPSFEDALRQKMSELPLPDENASWQKMNALLDENKRRRSFFFFKNEKIVGGALLLCVLMIGSFLYIQKETKETKPVVYKEEASGKTSGNEQNNAEQANNNKQINRANSANNNEKVNNQKSTIQADTDKAYSSSITSANASSSGSVNHQLLSQKKKTGIRKSGDEIREKNVSSSQSKYQNDLAGNNSSAQLHLGRTKKEKSQQTVASDVQKQNDDITKENASKPGQKPLTADSTTMQLSDVTNNQNTSSSDSVANGQNKETTESTLQKTDSASANSTAANTNIKINPRKTWFLDVGIGMKQQVPIDSQRFVSYNYNGNKSWFGDYIPYLYARLEKDRKWFLQGEFHYAAPRLINGVSYWQKSKVDYGHGTASTERYYLQKAWYHEVPLSLNIYIRPSWSVGAGAMFSWLRGAAAQRTMAVYDAASGQYNDTSKQISWKGFTDSFLYRNNTSLLLQTDYTIQRWSFGIRYLRDLHPYMTYTLPAGAKKDERNTALEVMIRYRLYRSDKFRIGKL